jgi:hypothetical protein
MSDAPPSSLEAVREAGRALGAAWETASSIHSDAWEGGLAECVLSGLVQP